MPRSASRAARITALVGVNGAGKSTLFKAIMGFVPAARGEIRLLGRTVREALRAQPRRLRAAVGGGGLELSRPRRGRRHDGALRQDGLPAPPAPADHAAVAAGARARQHGRLSPPADRRALRRAAQAGLPRPRAGAGRPGHPPRRAVHRRRREDRGPDRRPPARVARGGPGDAGLHPQPRLGAGVLRPHRLRQGHGAGLTAPPRRRSRARTWSARSAACCATSRSAATICTTTTIRAR